jgi:hypothetical protein
MALLRDFPAKLPRAFLQIFFYLYLTFAPRANFQFFDHRALVFDEHFDEKSLL